MKSSETHSIDPQLERFASVSVTWLQNPFFQPEYRQTTRSPRKNIKSQLRHRGGAYTKFFFNPFFGETTGARPAATASVDRRCRRRSRSWQIDGWGGSGA